MAPMTVDAPYVNKFSRVVQSVVLFLILANLALVVVPFLYFGLYELVLQGVYVYALPSTPYRGTWLKFFASLVSIFEPFGSFLVVGFMSWLTWFFFPHLQRYTRITTVVTYLCYLLYLGISFSPLGNYAFRWMAD